MAESERLGGPPVVLHLLVGLFRGWCSGAEVRAKHRLGLPAADLVGESSFCLGVLEVKSSGGSLEHRAAVKLAELSLHLCSGELSDAVAVAQELRSMAAEVQDLRLHRLLLSIQVTVQLLRLALDEAMRAAMELLAAAQRRRDRNSEAFAWLRIAEAHRQREKGGGTASTAEETLQAAERSCELYALGSKESKEMQRGEATAKVEAAKACLRLGRYRQGSSLASEAMEIFRNLNFVHRLTGALEVELEAHRGLMEPMIGLQTANRELQLLRSGSERTRGQLQAEAEILESIARAHGSLSEPLGAVRNALLAADLRKEIKDEV